jgi:MoaA/NifB/PqqE/SkfB family radical SAM enzyme
MQINNTYIKNIQRVEFTINNSCTSRCKHCSEGKLPATHHLDSKRAGKVLEDLSKCNQIDSIMTFGGEALLYPETVCDIHRVAKICNIPNRQLITNGCFSKKSERIKEVAKMLEESGVNDILLSVDCFHAEFLSLEWEREFAMALCESYRGRLRLQPSWLVSEEDDNPYNRKTRECLAYFDDLHLERNEGDVIFPEGNACIYLSEYFKKEPMDYSFQCGKALYTTPLDEVSELMIDCNGDVLPCYYPIGNILKEDIVSILSRYNPYENVFTKALLEDGIKGLAQIVEQENLSINPEDYYSPCGFCKAVADAVKKEN